MRNPIGYIGLLLVLSLSPLQAAAQASIVPEMSAPEEQSPHFDNPVSLFGGGFMYDFRYDDFFPMIGVAADQSFLRFFIAEARLGYAGVEPDPYIYTDASSTPIATADVGLHLQLPLPYVRPYVATSVGVVARGGNGEVFERFIRPSYSAALGARIDLSDRLALRGEVFRYRLDQHPGADRSALDGETTVGISYRF